MAGRRDDPKLGKHEVVKSVRIRLVRHFVLLAEDGKHYLACRDHVVEDRKIQAVEARFISCKHCRSEKYLNLED